MIITSSKEVTTYSSDWQEINDSKGKVTEMENEFAIPEAAEILGVEIATIYFYTSRKLLVPDKRIGKNLIFYRSTLARFKRPKMGWPKGKKRGPRKGKEERSKK